MARRSGARVDARRRAEPPFHFPVAKAHVLLLRARAGCDVFLYQLLAGCTLGQGLTRLTSTLYLFEYLEGYSVGAVEDVAQVAVRASLKTRKRRERQKRANSF